MHQNAFTLSLVMDFFMQSARQTIYRILIEEEFNPVYIDPRTLWNEFKRRYGLEIN